MEIAIEVNNINLYFGDRKVLENVSFKVKKRHVHGLLGPNGAGKTSTMKLIAKMLNPSSGHIKVNGRDIKTQELDFYQNIGLLLEKPTLYNNLSVREFVDYTAKLKKVPKVKLNEYVDNCLEVLDLTTHSKRRVGNLSKGLKQRVGIAQAIVHRPEIVILDEPTVGLDPQSVIDMRNLILKLKERHTVLLSSHLLHEMGLICDEVSILSKGEALTTGTIEELRSQNVHFSKICMELVRKSDEFLDSLEKNPLFSNIRVENLGDVQKIYLEAKTKDEQRPYLVEEAIRFGCGLLKIDKENSDLEEICMQITDSK